MSTEARPLPCPFCGTDQLLGVESSLDHGWLVVRCRRCGSAGPTARSETEAEAVAIWNSRAKADYLRHGHVVPRMDGVLMKCGGPGLCEFCSAEQDAQDAQS